MEVPHGSASAEDAAPLDGGLKPLSDIDLLVTVSARLDQGTRRALSLELLEISAWPGPMLEGEALANSRMRGRRGR